MNTNNTWKATGNIVVSSEEDAQNLLIHVIHNEEFLESSIDVTSVRLTSEGEVYEEDYLRYTVEATVTISNPDFVEGEYSCLAHDSDSNLFGFMFLDSFEPDMTIKAEILVITDGATREQFLEDIQSMTLYASDSRRFQAGNFVMLEDVEGEVDEEDYKEFFVDATGFSNLDPAMPFPCGKVTVRNHSYELQMWEVREE